MTTADSHKSMGACACPRAGLGTILPPALNLRTCPRAREPRAKHKTEAGTNSSWRSISAFTILMVMVWLTFYSYVNSISTDNENEHSVLQEYPWLSTICQQTLKGGLILIYWYYFVYFPTCYSIEEKIPMINTIQECNWLTAISVLP